VTVTSFDLWAWALRDELTARGLSHLRVKKHGKSLLVVGGSEDEPSKHFRLVALPRQEWRLDVAGASDRWEPTPFQGTLQESVALVADSFPWVLAERS
jgi:hypothetical protein